MYVTALLNLKAQYTFLGGKDTIRFSTNFSSNDISLDRFKSVVVKLLRRLLALEVYVCGLIVGIYIFQG